MEGLEGDDDEAEFPKPKEKRLEEEALSPAVLELAKEAKCLRLLKPKDRRVFARIWGKAHLITEKIQGYVTNDSSSHVGLSITSL